MVCLGVPGVVGSRELTAAILGRVRYYVFNAQRTAKLCLLFKKRRSFCPFLFSYLKKKSGVDKSTEWSAVPACPSLMVFGFVLFFLTGAIPKGLILRKFCLTFVYVLSGLFFVVVVCLFFFLGGGFVV